MSVSPYVRAPREFLLSSGRTLELVRSYGAKMTQQEPRAGAFLRPFAPTDGCQTSAATRATREKRCAGRPSDTGLSALTAAPYGNVARMDEWPRTPCKSQSGIPARSHSVALVARSR